MKAKMSLMTAALLLTFCAQAAMKLERLTISTANIQFSEQKTQVVSLEELRGILKQLTATGGTAPQVKALLIEGTISNPPARGMAPVNQSARLNVKSSDLGIDRSVVFKPDTYNRIELPLSESFSLEQSLSDLQLKTESLGRIGELKVSFVIDYLK